LPHFKRGCSFFELGKDSAWSRNFEHYFITGRDDEDEGSLLRGRVNPDRKRREKIERSADALRECHNPDSFPSEIIPLTIFSGQPENQIAGSGNNISLPTHPPYLGE
jgi:hypothetical protein